MPESSHFPNLKQAEHYFYYYIESFLNEWVIKNSSVSHIGIFISDENYFKREIKSLHKGIKIMLAAKVYDNYLIQ